jgi:hypothetical protein
MCHLGFHDPESRTEELIGKITRGLLRHKPRPVPNLNQRVDQWMRFTFRQRNRSSLPRRGWFSGPRALCPQPGSALMRCPGKRAAQLSIRLLHVGEALLLGLDPDSRTWRRSSTGHTARDPRLPRRRACSGDICSHAAAG